MMSFDNALDEIPIRENGTIACTGFLPYITLGRITRKASLSEVRAEGVQLEEDEKEYLYWLEYLDGRPPEWIWRSLIAPVRLEDLIPLPKPEQQQAIADLQSAWRNVENAQVKYLAAVANLPIDDNVKTAIYEALQKMERSHQELIAALQQAQLAQQRGE